MIDKKWAETGLVRGTFNIFIDCNNMREIKLAGMEGVRTEELFDDNEPINFAISTKGNRILWRGGYRHLHNKTFNNLSYWRCTQRNCKGTLTYSEVKQKVTSCKPHQCVPDFFTFEREKIIEGLRKAVAENLTTPAIKIYEDFIKPYKSDPMYEHILPDYDSIKMRFYRLRRKMKSANNEDEAKPDMESDPAFNSTFANFLHSDLIRSAPKLKSNKEK